MQAAIHTDPLLAAWNAQNITNSPPAWDWALSYGVILVLAAWGSVKIAQRRKSSGLLMVGWVLVTFLGMYVPLSLQRRLSIGLGVPMGLLAGIGWWRGARERISVRARSLVRRLIIAFSVLTPTFLIVATALSALGAQASSPTSWLYLTNGEWAAFQWLRNRPESEQEAVVLCAPQTGTFIPAWAGQRVVYGHPFETTNAEQREEQVEAYWTGRMTTAQQAAFFRENDVRYVLSGPREQALAADTEKRAEVGDLVFEKDDTRIYAVRDD
jgi:hypothetical protein